MRKQELYRKKVFDYIESVISGTRKAGQLEILAIKRHLNDLENATERGLYFDEKKAKIALSFFTLLKHYKGEKAGTEFELEGWQCFIVWSLFGWMRKGGIRRFNYANVEVARKNGKTTLAGGIALFMLLLDGEAGAEIYSAAVDKEQARLCWESSRMMVDNSPALSKYLKCFRASIVSEKTASSYKPLSRDSGNKDGLNPHCAICDERHAWKTDEMYNVIKSGMGARKQPMIFSITTAGFDMMSPYYCSRAVMINILEGVKIQDNTFVLIFAPDKNDDWKDSSTWEKSNPNIGVSVSLEYLENELTDAINKGSTTEVNFKTKNLDMWVDAPDVWIQDEKVLRCDYGTLEDDLTGQECWGGIDLASHVDINSLALYFPNLPHPVFRFYFWIPEGKVLQKEDRVDYRQWIKEGWVNVTPGDVIDIDFMVADLSGILKKYDVKNISFDPAKAYHGVIQGLQKEGFDNILDEFGQGIQNMSEPTKKVEADVTAGVVDLMNNPVIRWMFRNVVVYRDANDNIKLDKKRSIEKIDGVVTMAMAYGGYMSNVDDKTYHYTGMRFVRLF